MTMHQLIYTWARWRLPLTSEASATSAKLLFGRLEYARIAHCAFYMDTEAHAGVHGRYFIMDICKWWTRWLSVLLYRITWVSYWNYFQDLFCVLSYLAAPVALVVEDDELVLCLPPALLCCAEPLDWRFAAWVFPQLPFWPLHAWSSVFGMLSTYFLMPFLSCCDLQQHSNNEFVLFYAWGDLCWTVKMFHVLVGIYLPATCFDECTVGGSSSVTMRSACAAVCLSCWGTLEESNVVAIRLFLSCFFCVSVWTESS